MQDGAFAVAKGTAYADMAAINGHLVNAYCGEIYPGGVAVSGDVIAAVGV